MLVFPLVPPVAVIKSTFEPSTHGKEEGEALRSRTRQLAEELHKSVDSEKAMVFAFGDETSNSSKCLSESFSQVLNFPARYAQSAILQLELLQSICLTATRWLGRKAPNKDEEEKLSFGVKDKNILLVYSDNDFLLVSFVVSCIQTFRGQTAGSKEVRRHHYEYV